jgi:hypothetical protein
MQQNNGRISRCSLIFNDIYFRNRTDLNFRLQTHDTTSHPTVKEKLSPKTISKKTQGQCSSISFVALGFNSLNSTLNSMLSLRSVPAHHLRLNRSVSKLSNKVLDGMRPLSIMRLPHTLPNYRHITLQHRFFTDFPKINFSSTENTMITTLGPNSPVNNSRSTTTKVTIIGGISLLVFVALGAVGYFFCERNPENEPCAAARGWLGIKKK